MKIGTASVANMTNSKVIEPTGNANPSEVTLHEHGSRIDNGTQL